MPEYVGRLVHAFSIDGERGNPAFVCEVSPDQPIVPEQWTKLAIHVGSEVTCIQPAHDQSRRSLRFFTASGEIAFCGHGTLAAASFLHESGDRQASFCFQIGRSAIRIDRALDGGWSYPQPAYASYVLDDVIIEADILRALEITRAHRPTRIASSKAIRVGRSVGAPREKLLLMLADPIYLREIVIDANARDQLCRRLDVTGVYACAIRRDGGVPRLAARHFPAGCGDHEDMATAGIAPTAVRFACLWSDDAIDDAVIIEQGGPLCDNARLSVIGGVGDWQRIAGACRVA